MPPLILFDIDGTLLRTRGAGMNAMADAGKDLFGPHFTVSGMNFAGRLDPLLVGEMLTRNGVEPTLEHRARFRERYACRLRERLAAGHQGVAMPGVLNLLAALAREQLALGLLTGNFAETGSMKLAAVGIDCSAFTLNAWGDESPHDPPDRAHLPLIAMQRYHAHFGSPVHPARVTIIGDTPHDVRCAHANGCRCLAVATGDYSVEKLAACAPDLVLPSLADTHQVLTWLRGSVAAA